LCRIGSVTTDVKVTTTLPEWSDERAAPERLRKRWRDYIAALTEHENGHRVHGTQVAAHWAMPPTIWATKSSANTMSAIWITTAGPVTVSPRAPVSPEGRRRAPPPAGPIPSRIIERLAPKG
jgi:hypothetical protein